MPPLCLISVLNQSDLRSDLRTPDFQPRICALQALLAFLVFVVMLAVFVFYLSGFVGSDQDCDVEFITSYKRELFIRSTLCHSKVSAPVWLLVNDHGRQGRYTWWVADILC